MGSSIQATDLGSGFERWRQTCGTILKSSNCPMKRGGPSRLRAYPILSVAEQLMQKKEQEQEHHHHQQQQKQQQKHLGRSQDDYNELQDILQNYKEDEEERKMRGMVNQWKDELIRTSPIVRFMSKHLSIVGCSPYNETISATSKLPPILVTSCPEGQAGGFSPSFPGRPHSESGIVVCANRIMDKTHLEHTMAHEMIHWWDHCRFKVDWNNLRHHACTEIRAAVLSGDCRWSREILRRNFAFRKQFQACARRRAVLSVEGNPNCPDRPTAERAVDEVWQSCFNDHRPFDEVY